MNNELVLKESQDIQAMKNVEQQISDFRQEIMNGHAQKIPLNNLVALGTAFQPLTGMIQAAVSGGGGSGIYYVNTMGKTMHHFQGSSEFLGSLQTAAGTVGGGQARLTQLPCDPTMIFMAVTLMNIERKLDSIQETQEEILDFLKSKEKAVQKGNLNTLMDVLSGYKHNWNNAQYKTANHNLVLSIKKDARASIELYRDQIAKKLQKKSLLLSDQKVNDMMKKVQEELKEYRLALYLYSFSSFLEVMLQEAFGESYLKEVMNRIEKYSYEYRSLYTDCYDILEKYSGSSIQANVLGGLSNVSKFMGDTISKIPVISKGQLDESLIAMSERLEQHNQKKSGKLLGEFVKVHDSTVLPFLENLRTISRVHNEPTAYLSDGENLYVGVLKS